MQLNQLHIKNRTFIMFFFFFMNSPYFRLSADSETWSFIRAVFQWEDAVPCGISELSLLENLVLLYAEMQNKNQSSFDSLNLENESLFSQMFQVVLEYNGPAQALQVHLQGYGSKHTPSRRGARSTVGQGGEPHNRPQSHSPQRSVEIGKMQKHNTLSETCVS